MFLVWLLMGVFACACITVVGYAIYGISILIRMATGSRIIAGLSIIPLALATFFGIGYIIDYWKHK